MNNVIVRDTLKLLCKQIKTKPIGIRSILCALNIFDTAIA